MIGVKVTRLKEVIIELAKKYKGVKKIKKKMIRGLAGLTPYDFQTAMPYLKYRDEIGKFIDEDHLNLIIDFDGIRKVMGIEECDNRDKKEA